MTHPLFRARRAYLFLLLGLIPPKSAEAVTITTQQYRFLMATEEATWGPVLLKADGVAPFSWTLSSGNLPPGVTISSSGRIEGSLTCGSCMTCVPCASAYDFTVQVRDATNATATRSFRIRTAKLANVRTPALDRSELPLVYTQGGFVLGGADPLVSPQGTFIACPFPYPLRGVTQLDYDHLPSSWEYTFDPFNCDINNDERTKTLLRVILSRFGGSEVDFVSLEQTVDILYVDLTSPLEPKPPRCPPAPAPCYRVGDFKKVRRFHQLAAEVAAEPGQREFIGFYKIGHAPGFTFQEDLDTQPDAYRPRSLKRACGPGQPVEASCCDPAHVGASQVCTEYPTNRLEPISNGEINGYRIDITNDQAVAALLSRLELALDHEGPEDSSTGPLNGFLHLSEPTLTRGFFDVPWRNVPLFSTSARDKFIAFAHAKYEWLFQPTPSDPTPFLAQNKLPVRLAEFPSLDLPAHVGILADGSIVWQVWKEWVYDTWASYLEKLARTIAFAQAGNRRFRGTLVFQYPAWYSFTNPNSTTSPFSYTRLEKGPGPTDSYLANVTSTLEASPAATSFFSWTGIPFDKEVSFGNSIELQVRSPWIQAFLHENTTPSVCSGAPSGPNRAGEIEVLTAACGELEWYRKGKRAQLLTHEQFKLFGMFQASAYFGGPVHLSTSAPDDWTWRWDNVIPAVRPEIVAVLPLSDYVAREAFHPYEEYFDATNPNAPPRFVDRYGAKLSGRLMPWAGLMDIPTAWNPPSLGFIDSFQNGVAFGWAFDPWSRRALIDVKVVSGPQPGCSNPGQGNGILDSVEANIEVEPSDTAIRDFIKQVANYIPPESAKPPDTVAFYYSVDLPSILTGHGCPAGSYVLNLVARDRQTQYPIVGSTLTLLTPPYGTDLNVTIGGSAAPTAPSNLVATTADATHVSLTWAASTPPAGRSLVRYEIERKASLAGAYSVVGTSVATSFSDDFGGDSTVAGYLYRVRALDSWNTYSPYSNFDLATKIVFSDVLTAGATVIKAQHTNQLRQAVNAIRATADLAPATWTDASLTGLFVRALHVQELRDRLAEARAAIGLSATSYTDPTLTTGAFGVPVKAVHIQELRNATQ